MDKVQLGIFFVSGFLISRLFYKHGLSRRLVIIFVRLGNGNLSFTYLFMMFCSALLSTFIPNMLTVLMLLPTLIVIKEQLSQHHKVTKREITGLTLSLIYGANIGGMGSIIGSPANALMIGSLEFFNVAGREKLSFISWLGWGFPTVIVFVFLAWLIINISIPSIRKKNISIDLVHTEQDKTMSKAEKTSWLLTVISFTVWTIISGITSLFPEYVVETTIALSVYSAVFLLFLFFYSADKKDNRPLLHLKDCYKGFPIRGSLVVVIALVISMGIYLTGILDKLNELSIPSTISSEDMEQKILPEIEIDSRKNLSNLYQKRIDDIYYLKENLSNEDKKKIIDIFSEANFSTLLSKSIPVFFVIMLFCLITTFSTEFLSNTAVSISFFFLAYGMSSALGINTMLGLMAVALSSTCAFMTPIATPVNALAFGEVRGTSLRWMFLVGAVVNVLGAVIFAFLLTYIIPEYYNLH